MEINEINDKINWPMLSVAAGVTNEAMPVNVIAVAMAIINAVKIAKSAADEIPSAVNGVSQDKHKKELFTKTLFKTLGLEMPFVVGAGVGAAIAKSQIDIPVLNHVIGIVIGGGIGAAAGQVFTRGAEWLDDAINDIKKYIQDKISVRQGEKEARNEVRQFIKGGGTGTRPNDRIPHRPQPQTDLTI
jgi:divalent metal cation (Fe/Co/Zn/Cd) transporter